MCKRSRYRYTICDHYSSLGPKEATVIRSPPPKCPPGLRDLAPPYISPPNNFTSGPTSHPSRTSQNTPHNPIELHHQTQPQQGTFLHQIFYTDPAHFHTIFPRPPMSNSTNSHHGSRLTITSRLPPSLADLAARARMQLPQVVERPCDLQCEHVEVIDVEHLGRCIYCQIMEDRRVVRARAAAAKRINGTGHGTGVYGPTGGGVGADLPGAASGGIGSGSLGAAGTTGLLGTTIGVMSFQTVPTGATVLPTSPTGSHATPTGAGFGLFVTPSVATAISSMSTSTPTPGTGHVDPTTGVLNLFPVTASGDTAGIDNDPFNIGDSVEDEFGDEWDEDAL